jgi:hypothetical protein
VYILNSWYLCSLIRLTWSASVQSQRNTRIPSAHESREKLRNSDIFKRRLDDPNDEKPKKSDWHWKQQWGSFLVHRRERVRAACEAESEL